MTKKIIDKVNEYYTEKVARYGATSQGVDWNGRESHFLRFEQLCKVFENQEGFSVLDYGCGFGSLIEYLDENNLDYKYTGYDISEEMINKAKSLFQGENLLFKNQLENEKFDFVVANGIFNVKLKNNVEEWEDYVLKTLTEINDISEKGFSFNILTSYSDEEYKRDYLYYADPLYYFDYCKKHFSRNVSLLHDYDLYEFTVIAKK